MQKKSEVILLTKEDMKNAQENGAFFTLCKKYAFLVKISPVSSKKT